MNHYRDTVYNDFRIFGVQRRSSDDLLNNTVLVAAVLQVTNVSYPALVSPYRPRKSLEQIVVIIERGGQKLNAKISEGFSLIPFDSLTILTQTIGANCPLTFTAHCNRGGI